MTNDIAFLSDLQPRPWSPDPKHGFRPAGLFVGKGANAIEVAVARSSGNPTRMALLGSWKARRGGRAAPVLLVLLHPGGAALCGASGEAPPVYPKIDTGQVERLCREVLDQPDRHAALRFLAQALPSLETALPGLNNEGLVALHELQHGAPGRPDWAEARRKAAGALGKRDVELLGALGFQVERLDNLTSLLRSGDRRTALAVMLHESESPEAGTARFNSLSPVSYALHKADAENLPWVVLVQGNRLRLYSTAFDTGVGRRGRTETYIECQPSLLADEHLAYLWLLYSAEALAVDGSLSQILEDSQRFAGDLAERLRERIYDHVVPELAQGIAAARDIETPTPEDLDRTYEMALTVLFRLLFIAYAEDRDLLPYRFNEAYRRRSLKQKAQELAECVANGTPIAEGDAHWQEVALLWQAVAVGNHEWGVPAYDGGLFTSDSTVSRAGADLANITLPNEIFEAALRSLLVIETPEGVPGPVDFRSLGVREFGTVYEGLLESELALADVDLALNRQGAYVPAREGDPVTVTKGEIYLHNRSGARKSSGSYYTKHFAVEHLLDGALEPALRDHFARLTRMDDTDAAEAFFDFRVADIAMGSGHFLIAAIDRIEKGMADYLTNSDLPGVRKELAALRDAAIGELGELAEAATIEDGQLLRRLIARRCIYGVDLNALSVQLARLAVWIHTFVPGLPLSLLDHNLVCGNSLVGVGTVDEIRLTFDKAGIALFPVDADNLLGQAAKPLNRLARLADATIKDIEAGRAALEEARIAIGPTQALCDIIAALPIAEGNIRFQFERWEDERANIQFSEAFRVARKTLEGLEALHFPIAFPEVFLRQRPGFDVVLGNPPWDKVRFEEDAFYLRHIPGLIGLSQAERKEAIKDAKKEDQRIEDEEACEREKSKRLQKIFSKPSGVYHFQGTGHLDLAKLFLERMSGVLSRTGHLGIVLPRQCLVLSGWGDLRSHLFEGHATQVIQLRNKGGWVFDDAHHSYVVALITRSATEANSGKIFVKAGARDSSEFTRSVLGAPISWDIESLQREISSTLQIPLLLRPGEEELLNRLLRYPKLGSKAAEVYQGFPYAIVDVGKDIQIIGEEGGGIYLTRTRSISQFSFTPEENTRQLSPKGLRGFLDRKFRSAQWFPHWSSKEEIKDPLELLRLTYRYPSRNDDARSLIATYLPKGVCPAVGYAHSLVMPKASVTQSLFVLGFVNSIVWDWLARRFVDRHITSSIVQTLPMPEDIENFNIQPIVSTVASLLRHHDPTLEIPEEISIDYPNTSLLEMQCSVNLQVARALGVAKAEMELMLEDFTENGVDASLREAILAEL